jgi:hypothetical protein
LSVERSDGSLPRPDGFMRYPSETAQFYPYQVYVRKAWPSVHMVFAKTFPRTDGILEVSKLMDIVWTYFWVVRTWCWVVRTDCKYFPNSVDFWKYTPRRILIDRASGMCCSDVWTSGTDWFVLVFAKDSSWITSRSLWTIDVWIYEDSDLKTVVRIHEDWTTDCLIKTQPLHKVFLFYLECSQNTNKPPLWPF